MYTLIKCGVALLAMLGFAMMYQKRRLPLCFFPAVSVSGVSVALYLAGFFGILKAASYGIVIVGILALLRYFTIERFKAVFKDQSICFFVLASAWMCIITRNTMLSHYDEGSHWYRICKALCYEHAFPTTPDIFFTEYVPGCAIWVYFVTRYLGFSIPNAVFAQNILNTAAVSALFCAVPRGRGIAWKAFSFSFVSAAGVLLCSLTVSTYTLLVDVQIGLFAWTALIFVLDQGRRKEAFLPMLLLLCFLATIKTSALLFIVLVFVWASVWHRYPKKEWIKRACDWVVLPILLYSAYVIRSKLLYGNGLNDHQNVSLDRYVSIFGAKSPEVILQIAKRFFFAILLGEVESSIAVYAAFLFFVLLLICLKAENDTQGFGETKRFFIGAVASAAVYTVGLFVTYLFSMNEGEALTLNSLYRYYGTGAVLVVGITLYAALRLANRQRPSRMYVLSMLLIFVLLTPGAFSKRYVFDEEYYKLKEDFRSDIWRTVELYIPQNHAFSENSYVVLWNQDDFFGGSRDNGRVYGIVSSWIRSNDVLVISEWDLRDGVSEEILCTLKEYDYLAVISDMSRHVSLLSEYLGETDLSLGLHEINVSHQ